MTELARVWSAQDFDAVSIRANKCQVEVQGTDGGQVSLEGNFEGRAGHSPVLDVEGRWLKLNRFAHGSSQNLILKLPRDKDWVMDIFSGRGDIKVSGLRSRAHIVLGSGHVQVEDCRGRLAVSSGNADIQLKRFVQAEMPPSPPLPRESLHEAAGRAHWDWQDWEDTDWEEWGLDLGEKITGWALGVGRFFERTTINPQHAGLSIALGQGNIRCEGIESLACLVRTARGNVSLEGGRIEDLEVITTRGDVECASLMPVGGWSLRTMHGDIRLSLPANASARLDAATRSGDIRSEIPVVRVARQGPETYHGRRMVGMVGPQTESKVPELRLSTLHGDIDIKSQPPVYPSPDIVVEVPAGRAYRTQLEVLEALSEKHIGVAEAERLLHDLKVS